MLLEYRYTMELKFSQPVTDQHFSIMCIPRDTERQRNTETSITVEAVDADGTKYSIMTGMETDGFGNPYTYGVIHEPHSSFCLVSEGTAETGLSLHEEYEDPGSIELVKYKVESPLTTAGPWLRALHDEWRKSEPEDEYSAMLHYGNCVQAALSYAGGATGVDTTAEEAVRLGRGVCQDYAHVMISLLRMSGIPARYVTGMMQGEGETHAWVEANCRGYWYGIDPTNNILVSDYHIKFAHGRDYGDCMVSRGIFTNPYAMQTTQAGVTVHPADQ